ncbi:MAG: hypothetical protein JSV92_00915 [archaeon]|nr:MAG: hypothetical protein JSV92_00915 [archaeon]
MTIITVDDTQYFRAEESQIRNYMKRFETALLPVAEQAISDAGFDVQKFPKEGYYHKTPELQRYFDILRTLQENFTEKITPAIERLHKVYTHSVLGLGQGKPTAINPNVGLPEELPVTISPVTDPVSVASYIIQPDWTINGIMNNLYGMDLGTCLVGLATLVDKGNKNPDDSQNPLATCMACETTVLSRMKITYKGIPSLPQVDWKVSEGVEKYGRKVVEGYNDLFKISGHPESELEIPFVTPENVAIILDDVPSMERCVNLNIVDVPGKPKEYYHWFIEKDGQRHVVKDFFSPQIITTKEYQEDPSVVKRYLS